MTLNDFPRPRFEPVVNLGHIMIVIGWIGTSLGGGIGLYVALKSDIGDLRAAGEVTAAKMAAMERMQEKLAGNVDRLTQVVVTDARQDERINSLERWRGAFEHRGLTGPR